MSWLVTLLNAIAAWSPTLAKLLSREPVPEPTKAIKPTIDAGDAAAREAAKKRAAEAAAAERAGPTSTPITAAVPRARAPEEK